MAARRCRWPTAVADGRLPTTDGHPPLPTTARRCRRPPAVADGRPPLPMAVRRCRRPPTVTDGPTAATEGRPRYRPPASGPSSPPRCLLPPRLGRPAPVRARPVPNAAASGRLAPPPRRRAPGKTTCIGESVRHGSWRGSVATGGAQPRRSSAEGVPLQKMNTQEKTCWLHTTSPSI
jgi:hypothetical protein